MSDRTVYHKVELVGTSSDSIEDAIAAAIAHAGAHGHTVDWFEVIETRGAVKDGAVSTYQVVLKAGARLPAAR